MERVQSERRFIQRRCRESKSVGVLAVGNIRRAHLDVGEEGVRVLRRHILCERAWDGARVAPMSDGGHTRSNSRRRAAAPCSVYIIKPARQWPQWVRV